MRYSTHHVTETDILAVAGVMRSDWLTCGPKVGEFEAALCAYTGAKYAVAVSSGTAALHLAYRVTGWSGIFTSPLTFMATANAALLAEMDVHFVDVDSITGNAIPPEADHFWHKTYHYEYVPVHYAGRSAEIPAGWKIIEDACHALGAMDYDGCSRVGSCAHSLASCFSFHPVKPITTLGEGGAVTTNDQGFADEVRSLRSHGRDERGLMVRLGLNYRMTDAAAAMGIEQLKRCDRLRVKRHRLAEWYVDKLAGIPDIQQICCRYAFCASPCDHAHHLYPVRIKNGRRDEVKTKLNAQGIGAQVHYSPIVPLQPYYRERFGHKPGDFPNAEAWAAEELSLPLHARMTEADVERVVEALREALNG